MADETKRYLDYDGLAYLVERLTNRIEAVGGDYLPLKGGTLTGNLTVEGVTRLSAGTEASGDVTALAVLMATSGSPVEFVPFASLRSALDIPDPSGGGGTDDGVYIAVMASDGTPTLIPYEGGTVAYSGTVCGVAVVEGGRALLVAPTEVSGYGWSGSGQQTTGAYMTDSSSLAMADWAGRENTKAAVETWNSSTGLAFGWANAYSYGNVGAGKWWLPSVGELLAVKRHIDLVNSALSDIGGTQMATSYSSSNCYISSTQMSLASIWAVCMSGETTGLNSLDQGDSGMRVRAVSEWRWMNG